MAATRRIGMNRRTCVIKAERIDIHPSRTALIIPLLGVSLGGLCFFAILHWFNFLPMVALIFLLLGCIFLIPFSGMALIYSVLGAHIEIEKSKQSVRIHQGVLGLGIGTQELVPFWKIAEIVVEEAEQSEGLEGDRLRAEFAQWEIALIKTNGKRLPLGLVIVPRAVASEGLAPAREVAAAIAEVSGAPLRLPSEEAAAAPESEVATAPESGLEEKTSPDVAASPS